jgi:molybdate transport system ATP-binding protein
MNNSNDSLEIKQGEQWAIIGESGSGKSSFLQTIAGNFNITHREYSPIL